MKKRLVLGIAISLVALYLAFRSVDLSAMVTAMRQAKYGWIVPALVAMLVSVWLRAIRWGYFLHDTKRVGTHSLFALTMIGYMANNVLPLRVGELVRAYALKSTENVSFATGFSTIVVERILDLLSLVILLGVTLLFYPFPGWVRNVGLVTFVAIGAVTVWFFFLARQGERATNILHSLTSHFPERLRERVLEAVRAFLQGLVIFRRTEHYGAVTFLTFAMWALYAVIVYFSLLAFDFVETYNLPAIASFVVLVMVSIGISIPSSPGFVGTYDLLAQQSLAFFGVPTSEALGYAVVLHLVNYIPLTAIGLFYAIKMNIDYARVAKEAVEETKGPVAETASATTTAAETGEGS
jgi:uncharacterized protein (TIRG00374 family)